MMFYAKRNRVHISDHLTWSGANTNFFLFVVPILFLVACISEKKEQKDTKQAAGFAQFEFQEEFYNFGKVKAGENVSFTFQFKNVGEAPLIISGFDTDCGCIKVNLPQQKIKKGQTGLIEVFFNSAGEVGKQLKTVHLFANTKEKEKQLHITANVENELINIYSKN